MSIFPKTFFSPDFKKEIYKIKNFFSSGIVVCGVDMWITHPKLTLFAFNKAKKLSTLSLFYVDNLWITSQYLVNFVDNLRSNVDNLDPKIL